MALYQIASFDGNLTRKGYGTMNSALARVGKTHSVNNTANPGALTFNEMATNLDPTHATVADLIVGSAPNVESGVLYIYQVDRSGNVYKINSTNDSIALVTAALGITLKYGGGIKVVESGTTQYLVIAHDAGALYCTLAGGSSTAITGPTWTTNAPHPISDEFTGFIYFGNGNNLVQWSIASLAVISNSILNPTAPVNTTIVSLSVDGEGRYLRIVISTQTNFQDVITPDPTAPTQPVLGRTLYWNGIDPTYDSFDPFDQSNNTSSYSFAQLDVNFGQDWYGMAMYTDSSGTIDKTASLPFIRPPLQGALMSSGTEMFFGAPYYVLDSATATQKWKAGIFSFGTLDDQDQPELRCELAIPATANNTIVTQVGALVLVQNSFTKSDGTVLTNSKFYVSTYETGGTPKANLYSFNLTPGQGSAAPGVYETQKEKLVLPQQIKRVLVCMQPSTTGVSFQLDLIDADDTIPAGATLQYAFATGSDTTTLKGSFDNFEWAPAMKNMTVLGARITNLGTAQPSITGIFIETYDSDKSAVPPPPQQ